MKILSTDISQISKDFQSSSWHKVSQSIQNNVQTMLEATVLVAVFGGKYWEVQDGWVGYLYNFITPTGSYRKVECSPPKGRVLATRTESCEFESQQSHTKDIDKPERWLSSGQMFCERLLCPNGELNALGPPTQDPH